MTKNGSNWVVWWSNSRIGNLALWKDATSVGMRNGMNGKGIAISVVEMDVIPETLVILGMDVIPEMVVILEMVVIDLAGIRETQGIPEIQEIHGIVENPEAREIQGIVENPETRGILGTVEILETREIQETIEIGIDVIDLETNFVENQEILGITGINAKVIIVGNKTIQPWCQYSFLNPKECSGNSPENERNLVFGIFCLLS
jgi:hypothetical protein